MEVTEEQFCRAKDALSSEVTIFVHRLRQKCNCSNFEALVLTRAIIHSLLDNLGKDSLQEFEQFLAQVREGKIPL